MNDVPASPPASASPKGEHVLLACSWYWAPSTRGPPSLRSGPSVAVAGVPPSGPISSSAEAIHHPSFPTTSAGAFAGMTAPSGGATSPLHPRKGTDGPLHAPAGEDEKSGSAKLDATPARTIALICRRHDAGTAPLARACVVQATAVVSPTGPSLWASPCHVPLCAIRDIAVIVVASPDLRPLPTPGLCHCAPSMAWRSCRPAGTGSMNVSNAAMARASRRPVRSVLSEGDGRTRKGSITSPEAVPDVTKR
jgi:hypothetical protein